MVLNVALVILSLAALWLAPRHWTGWLLGLISEAVWMWYSLVTHTVALMVMTPFYALVYYRNMRLTQRMQRRSVEVAA